MDAVTLALMQYTAKKGGGDTTVEGSAPLTLLDAKAAPITAIDQYGLCTQSGTPTPAAPVDIMCNNGALTASKNIFDGGYTLGGTITNSGADGSTNAARLRLDYTLLPPGTYTLSTNGICNNTIVWAYSSATGSGATKLSPGSAFSLLPFTFTLSEAKYVRAMCRNSNNPTLTAENAGAFQIEAGESATEYMAPGLVYASGTPEVLTVSADGAEMQTASVPMLLSVGGYKDEAELISGIKTGKVGVSVYCGSADENWSRLGTNAFAVTNSVKKFGKHTMLCSHYTYTDATSAKCSSGEFGCSSGTPRTIYFKNELYDTVDDWRAALAADPIIVIYPLATATTEQTTPQHLSTHKGVNVLTAEAEVEPIVLSVTYKSGSGSGSDYAMRILTYLLRTTQRARRP